MKVKRRTPAPESTSPPAEAQEVAPYAALAAGYDVVMEHVEYGYWAEYVHHLIQQHHPIPQTVLELGCGTGSFALELQPLGGYAYTGTDKSEAMIRVARAKAKLEAAPIRFDVADFTDFKVEPPVDVVILLYDGMNYLLEEPQVADLLRHAYEALRPGGLFLFDQSTPANSINNAAYFEDQGEAEGFAYVRTSHYDPEARLHTTAFELTVEGATYHERHVQRAYTLAEVRALVEASPFEELAAYTDLSTAPATEETERVHWVLRRS